MLLNSLILWGEMELVLYYIVGYEHLRKGRILPFLKPVLPTFFVASYSFPLEGGERATSACSPPTLFSTDSHKL